MGRVLVGLLVSLFIFGTVYGHAELVSAEPPLGAILTQSPAEIRLTFSDAVSDGTITIIAEDFTRQELQAQAGGTDTVVFATVETPLSEGTYTVQYDVQAADRHSMNGSYTIEISTQNDGFWLIGLGLALLVGGVGLFLFRGQRS